MKTHFLLVIFLTIFSFAGYAQVDSVQLQKSQDRIEKDMKHSKKLDKKIERRERKINKQERRLKRQEHRRNKALRSAAKEEKKMEANQQ